VTAGESRRFFGKPTGELDDLAVTAELLEVIINRSQLHLTQNTMNLAMTDGVDRITPSATIGLRDKVMIIYRESGDQFPAAERAEPILGPNRFRLILFEAMALFSFGHIL
jgi:hypothetical protein